MGQREELEALKRAAERQAEAEASIREITADKDRSTLNLESLISRGYLLGFNISTYLEEILRTKNIEKIKEVHELLIEIQKWLDGNLWKVLSVLDEETCNGCDDCDCDDVEEEPILEEGTIYLKRSLIRQLAVLEAAWAKTHSDLIEELKARGDTHSCSKALHVHIELLERKIEMLSSKIRELV